MPPVFRRCSGAGNALTLLVVTSPQSRVGAASEQGQQLLLKAAGLGHGSQLPQLAGAQDHWIEVALKRKGALEAAAELFGAEGVGGTLIHGADGAEPGSGVMAGR